MDISKAWSEYTFVAFDTETTGRYPLVAEVVEIAAVKWRAGKVIETFQSLMKPNLPMGEAVIKIHHITNEMVASSPLIKDVLPKFDLFIQDSVLMAHHAAFDLGFLALEYEKLKLPLPTVKSLDTLGLSLKAFPKATNHRLATLVTMLGINVAQAHRALDDSQACLEVALKCMEKLGAEATLEYIFKAQGGAFEWQRFSISDLLINEVTKNLVVASQSQLVVEITYQGGTQPGIPRRLTPQGLVRSMGGDYVVGLCHRENCEKRFYLNRILTSKILD